MACLEVDKYLLLVHEIVPTKKLAEVEDMLLKRTTLGIKFCRVLLLILAVLMVKKKDL